MKAAVYRVEGRSHEDHLTTMASGLRRHGVETRFFDSEPWKAADFAVVWSWRVGLRIRNEGFKRPILVMERGYIGDRFKWTSLGWDGLNGRARFPDIDDRTRFDANFAPLMKPWGLNEGYALLIGQVRGDTALLGVDILGWYASAAVALRSQGWDVRFRQHPVEIERGFGAVEVFGAKRIDGTLQDALAGASLVVSYNSNTGVDAILAGVPVHAEDPGSMVYDLASQDYIPRRPVRMPRLRKMAWCQWSMSELKSGEAWAVVSAAM